MTHYNRFSMAPKLFDNPKSKIENPKWLQGDIDG